MRARVLSLLRLGEDPSPIAGAGEHRSFRPSRRFLYYSYLRWLGKQAAALAGILFSLAFFGALDLDVLPPELSQELWQRFLDHDRVGVSRLSVTPATVFWFFESFAIAGFTIQLVAGGYFVKLGWDLRRYQIGDDFLRIREGLWRVREQTFSLAKVQNVVLHRGPMQGLFGIADLEVHSAGGAGGSGNDDPKALEKGLHVGRLVGLDDAEELRRRIIRRSAAATPGPPARAGEPADRLAASRGLLAEARALRRQMARADDGGQPAPGL